MNDSCHVCELNAAVTSLPFRERLHLTDDWRLAHGWSALAGWLILAPRRHVESLAELTKAEAVGMAGLVRASIALKTVVGCHKTYVMLFAEQPRYHHVHVHVVPRMDWFSDEDRGPAVFRHLNVPGDRQVPADERERLARAIAAQVSEALA